MSGDTSPSTFSKEDTANEGELTTPTQCLFHGENILFTLRSKSPPVLDGAISSPIPDEANFRSVTLLTDERILMGSLSPTRWRNFQIRYEDITAITTEATTSKEHKNRVTVETKRCTIEIPTTYRTISRAITFVEKQVLESLTKAGERLASAAEVVESTRGASASESVYQRARGRLKRAETWVENHDLSTDGLPEAMIKVQKDINRVRRFEEGDVQDSTGSQDKDDESQREKETSEVKRERLIDELRTLSAELGRFPKANEFRRADAKFRLNEYQIEFGSWDEALDAAGIDKRESLLEEFRRVAIKLGKVPSTVEMDEHGIYSRTIYYGVFDSWSDIKGAVDVDPSAEDTEPPSLRRIDDDSGRVKSTQETHVGTEEPETPHSEETDILEEIEREFEEFQEDGF